MDLDHRSRIDQVLELGLSRIPAGLVLGEDFPTENRISHDRCDGVNV
jgi:hypothetical protein